MKWHVNGSLQAHVDGLHGQVLIYGLQHYNFVFGRQAGFQSADAVRACCR